MSAIQNITNLIDGATKSMGTGNHSQPWIVLLVSLLAIFIGKVIVESFTGLKYPIGIPWFEPVAIARLRFSWGARDMIHKGYINVSRSRKSFSSV